MSEDTPTPVPVRRTPAGALLRSGEPDALQTPVAAAAPTRGAKGQMSPPLSAAPLVPGTRVRLHSLQASAAHNNKLGVLEKFIAASGRWEVKFDSADSLRVRPQNLTLVPAGTTEAGADAPRPPRVQRPPTSQEMMGVSVQLNKMALAEDWLAVVAMEPDVRRILPHIPAINKLAGFQMISLLGSGHLALENYVRAIDLEKEAAKGFLQLKSKEEEARSFHNIGIALRNLNELTKAASHQKRALAVALECDSPFILCKAYSALGSVYHAQGKSADALEMLNHSLKIAKDKGYRGDEASALSDIGACRMALSETSKAILALEECLRINRETIKDDRSAATTLAHLGRAHAQLGDAALPDSIEKFEQALALLGKLCTQGKAHEQQRYRAERGDIYHSLALAFTKIAVLIQQRQIPAAQRGMAVASTEAFVRQGKYSGSLFVSLRGLF